jgi:cysteine/O-acetylserine efflux protein
MQLHWLATCGFILVTTFTPGPNNISSMSIGIASGYKRTLPFLSGITIGFIIVMSICATLASVLLISFPHIQPFIKIAGSIYIGWLALQMLFFSVKADHSSSNKFGFSYGFFLQFVNPKSIIYGLTLYSTLFAPLSTHLILLLSSAFILGLITFSAISLWAIVGASMARILTNDKLYKIISIALSTLLFYSAIESSGILALIKFG